MQCSSVQDKDAGDPGDVIKKFELWLHPTECTKLLQNFLASAVGLTYSLLFPATPDVAPKRFWGYRTVGVCFYAVQRNRMRPK